MSQICHNNALTNPNVRNKIQSSTKLASEGSFSEVPWWRVLT
jgi:hypothetical protein